MQIRNITAAVLIALCGVAANAATASSGALAGSFIALAQGVDETGGYVGSGAGIPNVRTEPVGAIGNWLAASPGNPATVSFGVGTTAVGFEWGTPSNYDSLVVNEENASGVVTSTTFSYTNFGLTNFGPDGYVTVTASAHDTIVSLVFKSGQPAFEAANFTAVAVPEPANVALLLAGVGMLGFMARKRST